MTDEAIQRGIDNLMQTFGRVPDTFRVMLEHAPEAFAGYTTMRSFAMRDRHEGPRSTSRRRSSSSSCSTSPAATWSGPRATSLRR